MVTQFAAMRVEREIVLRRWKLYSQSTDASLLTDDLLLRLSRSAKGGRVDRLPFLIEMLVHDNLVQRTEVQEWITPRLAQLKSNKSKKKFDKLDAQGLVAEMLRMADEDGDGSLSMDEVQSTLHQSEHFERSALHDVLHFEML